MTTYIWCEAPPERLKVCVNELGGWRNSVELVLTGQHGWTRGLGEAQAHVLRADDPEAVEEKYGLTPEQYPDFAALRGDPSDNLPKIPGVGEKTATKWIVKYGDLDNLIEHADEIKGKVGENLRAARDFLPLARKLLTVRCDLDLPVRLDDLQARPPQREKLLALYERLEFQAWLNELRAQGVAAPAGQEGGDGFETPAQAAARRSAYACITDWDEFERWLGEIEQGARVAFDTETTSLDARNASLVGVSFAVGPGRACYIPLAHRGLEVGPQLPREEVLRRLAPWFATADGKVAQNAKYDWHVLAAHGAEPGGTIDDTMLMSYVLESDAQHDLDRLSRRWLSLEPLTYAELCGSGKKQIGFDEVPPARAAAYAAEDADLTWRLFEVLSARLAAEPRLERVYRDIERPLVPVLVAMERAGVAIDPKVLAAQSREFETQLRVLEQKAHELAGRAFNLASPKQVAELLFGELGLKAAKKTAGGQASTSEEVLERLAHEHPIVEVLLQHRQLSKLKNTYLDKLPKMIDPRTGRVHTTFSQSVVVTGRLSSSEPNLQNIPARTPEGRRIRSAFVAPTGCLRAELEAVGHADAIHLDQHAVALQPADVEAGVAVATGAFAKMPRRPRRILWTTTPSPPPPARPSAGHVPPCHLMWRASRARAADRPVPDRAQPDLLGSVRAGGRQP